MRRKIFYAPILFAFGIGVLGNPAAWAAGGDCPTAFDSDDCDVGGTTVCEVITIGSEETILCDLSAAGGDSAATVVHGYNGTNRYSAWGSYTDTNTKFCCAYSGSLVGFSGVKLDGSEYNDTLKFTYNGTHELSETGVVLHATIDGHDGNDTITGSNRNSANYLEWLEGGGDCTHPDTDGGDDTIVGGGGDDTLWGQCGDDLILGGPGNDEINGGTENDTILGGSGADTIDGYEDDDLISGGDGMDEIDGGGGNSALGYDVICGEGDADTLNAHSGDGDLLWGAASNDVLYCAGIATSYSYTIYPDNCIGTLLTVRPDTCPE